MCIWFSINNKINHKLIPWLKLISEDECYTSGSSHLYAGKRNCGLSGTTCQAWNQQTPHAHTYISADFPDVSIDDAKNYCRDPAGSVGEPWCYTTNSSVLWEICEIPECSGKIYVKLLSSLLFVLYLLCEYFNWYRKPIERILHDLTCFPKVLQQY